MSNIEKFNELIKTDATLRARVTALADGDVNGLVALANEAGLPFSPDEYTAYQRSTTGELTDDQLDSVSGTGSRVTKVEALVIKQK